MKPRHKPSEVGVIPSDWDVRKLGDIAAFRTGPFGTVLHKSDYTEDGIPVINPMHIIEGRLVPASKTTITDAAAKQLAHYRLEEGDILIARRGEAGRCAVVRAHEAGWLCGTGSMIVRGHSGMTPDFFQRVLSSPRVVAALEDASVGSTMINLNTGSLAALRVQYPPPNEQRAIAEALSVVDALIESLDQLIAKKRDIKQAAKQQLLTGQRRLPGFSGEWEEVPLGNIASPNRRWSFTGGPFGSNLKSSDYTDEGVRIIQLQNIGDGEFKDGYEIYTSEAKADELLSCNIFPGEIILSKMGDPVARACIIPARHERYLMCSDGIRLAVDPGRFDTYFVYTQINAPDFRNRAANAGTGSTRKRIGLSELRALELRCPPLPEQTAIAVVLAEMDSELATLELRRDKTRALKQGMMQELLTGRTRLI